MGPQRFIKIAPGAPGPPQKPVLVGEREARLFFLSFLRFRVVSNDFGRAIAPLALVFCSFLPLQNSIHIYDFPLFFVCSESFWMAKKLSNSMPKTLQKSWTQIHLNPAKIDAKTSQNRSQESPKSRSGGDSAGNRFPIQN